MTQQNERMSRMTKLFDMIKSEGEVEKDELFSKATLTLGISFKTFEEYLMALKSKGVRAEGSFVKYTQQ